MSKFRKELDEDQKRFVQKISKFGSVLLGAVVGLVAVGEIVAPFPNLGARLVESIGITLAYGAAYGVAWSAAMGVAGAVAGKVYGVIKKDKSVVKEALFYGVMLGGLIGTLDGSSQYRDIRAKSNWEKFKAAEAFKEAAEKQKKTEEVVSTKPSIVNSSVSKVSKDFFMFYKSGK